MENHELGPREDDPGYWDGLQPQSPCPGCGELEDCQCEPEKAEHGGRSKLRIGLLLAIPFIAGWLLVHHALKPDDYSQYSMIHMPKSGKCPDGYRVANNLFSREGKEYAGCVSVVNKGMMLDALYPGESVNIAVELPK